MFLTALIIFLIFNLLIFFSLRKKNIYKTTSALNKISVVIAAKNEADNIPNLIKALKSQNYDKNFFEVIIVDDNSTDETYKVVEQLITNHRNFHLLKAVNKKFGAKKGALDIGISHTNHDYILITDADSKPEYNWIESYNRAFQNDYDFVFGKVIKTAEANFINKVSRFENLRNSILIFAASNLKTPYCAYGSNFGFNKKSFLNLGGYSSTNDKLSGDDDLLIREAVKNNMKIGTVDSKVWSSSKSTLKDYISQRSRHTSTSHNYILKHQLLLGIWHLLNLILLFAPIITFQFELIILSISKIMIDLLLLSKLQKEFTYSFNFIEIIYSQIIYDIMIIVNFFSSLIKKESWK
ncbi:MAG: glycosyltransferase [Melioribacteraceae bacterium]|nr:glycosyltransferase [Melioribacteraceae bacterium]